MIRKLAGVIDVHHVHAWSLTQGRNVFSAHIRVDDLGRDGQRVLKDVHDMLRGKFGMYFSTLQVEDACLDEEDPAKAIDVTRADHSPAAHVSGKVEQESKDR
jgi:cobalt-zinc-cadmium efflux system protein